MKTPFTFCDSLVIRVPRLPFQPRFGAATVQQLLWDAAFMESVYIASPVLYDELVRLREGGLHTEKEKAKVTDALVKYYTRSYSRCTPFGSFSTCTTLPWAAAPDLPVFDDMPVQRRTRLDMYYLRALAQQLEQQPAIREHLLYYPNNSRYITGHELRYMEYSYVQNKRHYRISAVACHTALQTVLEGAAPGATLAALSTLLTGSEAVTAAEALAYVTELADAQVLVSELEPAITGPGPAAQLLQVLQRLSLPAAGNIVNIFEQIAVALQALDAETANPVTAYAHITALVKQLGAPVEAGKLLQVDAFRPATGNSGLPARLQSGLLEALHVLQQLGMYKSGDTAALQDFTRAFYARYADEAIPLVQALDAEAGIGYPAGAAPAFAPLVAGLAAPVPDQTETPARTITETDTWLLAQLTRCLHAGKKELVLEDDKLPSNTGTPAAYPPSMSAMFRLLNANSGHLQLEGFFGPSAAGMLGRFAHDDAAMHQLALHITREEQRLNEGVVFAEIIHLPDDRTGNVLLHPAFRDYEIPYLAQSSLPAARQIPIQDLYLRVADQQLQLFSKQLNKQIIPRLSNMHNYAVHTLPVYRFLCDLQKQGLQSAFLFEWKTQPLRFAFLPRVRYKNIVLSVARWQLEQTDIAPLQQCPASELAAAVRQFRTRWQLPQLLVLADGDHELLVDLDNLYTVQAWLRTVKQRASFTLKEFLTGNGKYIQQCVAPMIKTTTTYSPVREPVQGIIAPGIRRSFPVGSEWLYYKLYCGPALADQLLTEQLRPAVQTLMNDGITDQWFFIRYLDPDFHLRVRFHLTDTRHIGKAIGLLARALAPLQASHLVWKTRLDTYKRELERYGGSATMALSETLFFYDSQATLELLAMLSGDEQEQIKWLWALKAMDSLLDDMQLDAAEKKVFIQQQKAAFAREMQQDKPMRQELNRRYEQHAGYIHEIMGDITAANRFYPVLQLLEQRSTLIKPLAEELLAIRRQGRLTTEWHSLLGSYVHMMINRIMSSEPRLYEMALYDFLAGYERSKQWIAGAVSRGLNY
ncbi:MAG TPA: lantibiotic dehydratase [Chitinophaga sp.]|uniref:lantibiotic dehydratase n=1 Tax=Chitinophaga sp. TaxID=1869181 RepID=UPI002DB9A161|nr:lantibiotic dehydratase [Chitinophaga sp.]HEU4555093.1 lantibiotic dehydratase [Chitinophaga sp.]